MAVSPLISHSSRASVYAYRDGAAITVAQFLHDVEKLAQQLPDRHYILNLCTDRYRFSVGFAAALLRGQTSLPLLNYTASFVAHLGLSYPDLYCLADGEVDFPDVTVLHFPTLPQIDLELRAIPSIQSAQRAALVFTSGSTGHPVAHAKSWGSLCKGATAEAASLHIVPDCGMAVFGTVPAQHMYGLESSMLLAMHNGLALVAERPFIRPISPARNWPRYRNRAA